MKPEFRYRGYGLRLSSEIPLPGFRSAGPDGAADVRIRISGAARQQWQASGAVKANGISFFAAPGGGFVMRREGVGDYWVRDGAEIDVTPASASDLSKARLYLVGGAVAMAFYQRGMLVLHGATVRHRSRAVIVSGASRIGKSTVAALLGQAGYAVLCDDIMPLWPRAGGGFEVWPGSQLSMFWPGEADILGGVPAEHRAISEEAGMSLLPSPTRAEDAPLPLDKVVVLTADDRLAHPVLESLANLQALRAVSREVFRRKYGKQLGHEALIFRQCCDLAATSRVMRLRRPWDEARIGESVALLRSHWDASEPASGSTC